MEQPAHGHDAVERFYSRWAGLYDLLASGAPGIARVRKRAVDALSLAPGETAVEMGAGTGANLPHLRRAVGPGGRVVGIDLAAGVLARSRSRVGRAGWENVGLVRGNATRPPVRQANAVLATFVVGMFDDPGGAVDHWCDLLAPGGRITLLHAGRSDHPLAAPANLAFRGFVRLGAPGNRLSTDSPALDLERSVEAAAERLQARCVEFRRESLAGGYLTLDSGRVPE